MKVKMKEKMKEKDGQKQIQSHRLSWETVGELCQKAMTPALAQRLASLVESREQGTLPEQIFFRDVLAVVFDNLKSPRFGVK